MLIFLILFLTPSGNTTRRFVGHSKDVLSVAFSADNRQIVSGSRDRTIKLWNTLGVCKYTIQVNVMGFSCEQSHNNWNNECNCWFLIIFNFAPGLLTYTSINTIYFVRFFSTGWQPLWVGFLCALLPQQQQPHHCLLWLGQDCEGTMISGTLIVLSSLPNDLNIMACITWHFSDEFFTDEGTSCKAQHYDDHWLHWFY